MSFDTFYESLILLINHESNVKNKLPFKPNVIIKGTDIDSDLISTYLSIEISFLNSLSISTNQRKLLTLQAPPTLPSLTLNTKVSIMLLQLDVGVTGQRNNE